MKNQVGKLDVDKLVVVPADLSKRSDVVKILLKKMYIMLKLKNIEDKILGVANIASTAALTAVKNKIPNVSNLVKKPDYSKKISEIKNNITTDHNHDIYIYIYI